MGRGGPEEGRLEGRKANFAVPGSPADPYIRLRLGSSAESGEEEFRGLRATRKTPVGISPGLRRRGGLDRCHGAAFSLDVQQGKPRGVAPGSWLGPRSRFCFLWLLRVAPSLFQK